MKSGCGYTCSAKGVDYERCVLSGSKTRVCNTWKDMYVSKPEKDHENRNPTGKKKSFIMKTLLIKKVPFLIEHLVFITYLQFRPLHVKDIRDEIRW